MEGKMSMARTTRRKQRDGKSPPHSQHLYQLTSLRNFGVFRLFTCFRGEGRVEASLESLNYRVLRSERLHITFPSWVSGVAGLTARSAFLIFLFFGWIFIGCWMSV